MSKPSVELLKAGLKTANKGNKQLANTKPKVVPKAITPKKQTSDASIKNAEQRLAMHEATRTRLMEIPDTKRTAEDNAELARAIRNKDRYTVYLRELRTNRNPGKLPHQFINQGL
jgi:hypothetical protein